ncbi:MAG: hypothetical protein Q8L48_06360 [Archangium sp.]|nr:hypothetical protein [Archangium sp.]
MASDDPTDVMRLTEVLEQLDALHGRSVWVRGVLSLEFEGRELRDGSSRIWVDLSLPQDLKASLASLDGRQVIVRGTVDRDDTGHGPLAGGPRGRSHRQGEESH